MEVTSTSSSGLTSDDANRLLALHGPSDLGVTLTLLAVLVFVPVVRDAFKLGSVNVAELLAPLFAATLSITWFEAYKIARRYMPSNRQ